MKKNRKTTIFLAMMFSVFLIIPLVMGMISTNSSFIKTQKTSLSTTSSANITVYEKYAFNEIENYILKNRLSKNNLVIRKSTKGVLRPSSSIKHYDLNKYNYYLRGNQILFLNKFNNEVVFILEMNDCDVLYDYGDGITLHFNKGRFYSMYYGPIYV